MSPNLITAKEFPNLFIKDTPFLDVRAPIEFQKGAFPHAVNLPILNTEERDTIGKCYKQQGSEAATKLGHELVSGKTKTDRIQAWTNFIKANPNAVLYCFRGGQRSQITQGWLKEQGVDIPRIEGGYKAMRQFLIQTIDDIASTAHFTVITGRTGSGKTIFLKDHAQAIDLEGLANHRGSAFGRRVQPQPQPIDFENTLAIKLLKQQANGCQNILLENESFLIGTLPLPKSLYNAMGKAPLVELKTTMEERVSTILKEYVVEAIEELEPLHGTEAVNQLSHSLIFNLDRIQKRLGKERYREVHNHMTEAIDEQLSSGDVDLHKAWIEKLLVYYYDPFYDYSLEKNRDRIVFSGNATEIQNWVLEN